MPATATKRLTYADYIALERETGVKHEFLDGVAVAMVGGTADHALLTANTIIAISSALHGRPCRVYSGDLRVRMPEDGLATYPDLSVICGEREAHPDDPDTAFNPVVLVEVLSPSTEKYVRGEKFRHYRTLDSLKAYVLISQDAARIEVFEREEGPAWRFVPVEGLDAIARIDALGIDLPLATVYDGAEFLRPAADDPPAAEDPAQA